jgi:hypothetical protein
MCPLGGGSTVDAMDSHLHQLIARDRIDERCHAAATARLRREAGATRPSRPWRLVARLRLLAGATGAQQPTRAPARSL